MFANKLETLLDLLDVKMNAFAICEIGSGCSLRCDPLDMIVVHFVLQGRGTIEWAHGSIPVRPGMMIIVPRRLPKRINGPGPIAKTVDAAEVCPMADGMLRFRACGNNADLILGCGSVLATTGDGRDVLDGLAEPLAVQVDDEALPLLFKALLAELSMAGVGTRAVVGAMMKQIMLLLLRSHLMREGSDSPLYPELADERLVRAVSAMIATPKAGHTLESLARIAGMSRSRFGHHFEAAYGKSPMHFLQHERLEKAARMLQTTALPIKSVASEVGYASRSHFSRTFRSKFGVDPSQFREQHRRDRPAIGSQPSLGLVRPPPTRRGSPSASSGPVNRELEGI